MQRILLLGGSAAQTIAIKKAKELGLYTVLCDYLPDNPGRLLADKFYLVSTTDKEAVLEVAQNENINGIVAYSSDPAAPTAAYVAEKMNLPGHNYNSVRHFCEKQLFRKFLKENGFNVPQSYEISVNNSYNDIDLPRLNHPLIIKPTDSSGSKGITVINTPGELAQALEYAAKYSRNNTLIAEEFIQRDHPHVIEAEIFVINGTVVSWGIINSIRDINSNPLLPAAYSYPVQLPKERLDIVKSEVSRLVSAFGKSSGAFNIEMIIDKRDRLFFLDAGPRNGGNMLPEFISMISGKDIVKATILTAMGQYNAVDVDLDGFSGGFWGLGVLHSTETGVFSGIEYSKLAKESLLKEVLHYKPGQNIRPFQRCDDLLGLNFLRFNSKQDMDTVMEGMDKSFKIRLSSAQ